MKLFLGKDENKIKMDYQIGIFLSVWIVLGIVVGIMLLRNYTKKRKSGEKLAIEAMNLLSKEIQTTPKT